MSETGGWAGKVLHVDLTEKRNSKIPTQQYEPEKYLGGMGLNFKIFWELGCPKVEAFDPENPLIIASGPLTGLPGPFSRAEVCSISPQAYPDELFTYSGFGGKWPSELKYAGYDAVVVVGKSDEPVYISIHDDRVEILSAEHLWGLDTHETQRVVMREDPGASVLCMGPAGENLSRNASIANETGSTAGQGGFGAVMGSKNLKAIAIRGTGSLRIARPETFMQFIFERKAMGEWLEGASQIWGREPLAGEETTTEMVTKYRKKFGGCFACPYQCQAFYDMPGVGRGQALCASWGWAHQHDDARSTWQAQILSQKTGINQFDLIGIWQVLKAIAEEKMLTEQQWEHLRLPPVPKIWGGTASDEEFNEMLMQCITNPDHPLSQGGARAFAKILDDLGNGKRLKQQVQLTYPAYGQASHYFGWLTLALHVAMDTRDSGDSTDAVLSFGDANVACFDEDRDAVEVSRIIGDYFDVPHGIKTYAHPKGSEVEAVYEGIERQTVFTHREHCLKNSLTVCNFAFLPDQYFNPPEMDYRIFAAKMLSAATGMEIDAETLWEKVGDRIWNLQRAIMIKREGRTRADDTLSDALFDTIWFDRHPGTYEVLETQFDREEFEVLKDRYYEMCGWDARHGWPFRETLEALDMIDVAEVLAEEGLLGKG